jgi:tRNA G10  N-methylase Trm11
MKSFAILGRQPAIGFAELESLFGSSEVEKLDSHLASIDQDITYPMARNMGSVIKVGKIHSSLSYNGWQNLEESIIKALNKELTVKNTKKINFGISVYSLSVKNSDISALGIKLKRQLQKQNFSPRLVQSGSGKLSTAQIINNKLDGKAGIEVVVYGVGSKVIIGTTTYEQDITGYTARDQARPKRDAYVGMLPPKLAQTIINLATGQNLTADRESMMVLDPFCGTGVILQEALLMGYSVYGSDISPKMVDYSIENIDWLKQKHPRRTNQYTRIEIGDATTHTWEKEISIVASETYLGSPISMIPNPEKLQKLVEETNVLHKKMLQNLATQIKPGTRLCLAVPAWRLKNGFASLPTLDLLAKIGYNRIDFKLTSQADLIYIRDNQFVGRELVVLEKS